MVFSMNHKSYVFRAFGPPGHKFCGATKCMCSSYLGKYHS